MCVVSYSKENLNHEATTILYLKRSCQIGSLRPSELTTHTVYFPSILVFTLKNVVLFQDEQNVYC
jgi:hypothetical protein